MSSSSSNPRDHRGRYVPGSSARHSSRSNSNNSHRQSQSQPYVSSNHNHNHNTDDWESPEYAEGYYRRQFMERRSYDDDNTPADPPRPSAPPMDEDEVLARQLQHEINAEFLRDRDVVVVPPPSRYVITPVDNEVEVPYHQQQPQQQYRSSSRAAEPDGRYSYSTSNRRKHAPPQENNNYRYSTSTAAARGTHNVGMTSSSSSSYHKKQSSRRDMMIVDLDEEEDLRLAQQLQDEELARQLEQEEAEARRKAARQQQKKSSPAARASTQTTATTSFSDSSSEEQAAARRVAQEMEDAEIAQRLSLYEQEVAAHQVQESTQSNRSHLIWHRLLPLVCCAVAIIVSLLFVLNVFDGEKVRNGINDWVDPFKGDVAINGSPAPGGPTGIASDQMAWRTNGRGGLELEILNAMDDRWTQPLSVAVQNWDDGYPIDSLTLRVTRVSVDPTCTEETGKLKICNADYGNTRWRGLNNLLLNRQTQEIVASSAKMNEFYLERESNDQKLYTLCHELGHGFGLPHWDEDFFNRDMGNCMDYTQNPGANKRPDVTNFNFLSQLYGGRNITSGELITAADAVAAAGDTNVFNENSVTATEAQVEGDKDNNNKDDDDKNNNNKKDKKDDDRRKRVLRKLLRSSSTLPSQVIFTDNKENARVPSHRRRILHASKHFEVHRILSEDEGEDDDYVRLQFYLMV